MTPEQQAALVMAQAVGALSQLMAMAFENLDCQDAGRPFAHRKEDFNRVVEEYGLHHNQVISYFQGR